MLSDAGEDQQVQHEMFISKVLEPTTRGSWITVKEAVTGKSVEQTAFRKDRLAFYTFNWKSSTRKYFAYGRLIKTSKAFVTT